MYLHISPRGARVFQNECTDDFFVRFSCLQLLRILYLYLHLLSRCDVFFVFHIFVVVVLYLYLHVCMLYLAPSLESSLNRIFLETLYE